MFGTSTFIASSKFCRCTRLRNSVTCVVVLPASSTITISSSEPPRPFSLYGAGALPAFISSITNSAEFFSGTPNGAAAGPDRNVTMPIFTGSCASAAGASAVAASASTICLMRPTMSLSSVMVFSAAGRPRPARRGCARSRRLTGSRAVRGEHVDGTRARLQHAYVPFMELRVRAPVLDGAHARHLVCDAQQRLQRVAITGGDGILECDERQIARLRDALEMLHRHLGALAEVIDVRREHEQRRRAAVGSHARDARGFETAVRVHAVHDGQR